MLYSHNTTIQIYRCREIRNTDDSPLFRYETFINFLTLVFRHEERETQFLLCWLYFWPNKRAAHPVAPKISVGRDLQNSMVRLQLQLSAIEADKPTVSYIVHSQPPAGLDWPGLESNLNCLFQNQILSPSLPGMTSFTPQSYLLSGIFIMTFVIVISSAHERGLYSMCVHLHLEPNSSKPNQTEW